MQHALGKFFREGLSIKSLFAKFPTNQAAEDWFVSVRWPDGIACHYCGSIVAALRPFSAGTIQRRSSFATTVR